MSQSNSKVIVPLFYRAAGDAMFALNVVIAATGSAEIIKLASELDLEMQSISKKIQEDANYSAKDKVTN